ncbi:hypothetical protein A0O36_02418 [Piscirickettsiaceae bacterium NZ-RLO1]|nr:hypothetical protein A0O36_02418 [Piscirickettsiaceae bacterium NZ-RLO1]
MVILKEEVVLSLLDDSITCCILDFSRHFFFDSTAHHFFAVNKCWRSPALLL